MNPLIAKWGQLSDDDRDLFQLLEVRSSAHAAQAHPFSVLGPSDPLPLCPSAPLFL